MRVDAWVRRMYVIGRCCAIDLANHGRLQPDSVRWMNDAYSLRSDSPVVNPGLSCG